MNDWMPLIWLVVALVSGWIVGTLLAKIIVGAILARKARQMFTNFTDLQKRGGKTGFEKWMDGQP